MISTEDFGFIHTQDIEYEEPQPHVYRMNFEPLEKSIFNFLEKLKGDIDSNNITWPGEQRHKQIDEFIKKVKKQIETIKDDASVPIKGK